MLSFIPIGIPADSPEISPLLIFSSISDACLLASSVNVVTNACTSFSFSLILCFLIFLVIHVL